MTLQHVLDLGSALDRLREALEQEPCGVVRGPAWEAVRSTMERIELYEVAIRDEQPEAELL